MCAFASFVFTGCTNDYNEEIQQENISNKKVIDNNEQQYETFSKENIDIGYLNTSEIVIIIENIKAINEGDYDNEEKELLIRSELNPFTDMGRNVISYITENHDVSDPSFELTEEERLMIN